MQNYPVDEEVNPHPDPEVIKLFSYHDICPAHIEMPTIVGILTFIGMINTTAERLKARNLFIYGYFSFYEQLKFCSVELIMKKSVTSGPDLLVCAQIF